MVMYGVDTERLSELATRYEICARAMVEHSGRLSTLITSVLWEGSDADSFRRSWGVLAQQIQGAHADLQRQGHELQQHAEEQDRASAADGASLIAGVRGLSGTGALSSSSLGWDLGPLAVAAPGPGGLAGALSASLGPIRLSDEEETPTVPDDHDYASPQGDQTHTAGEENRETVVTGKDGQGNEVTMTFGDDGSVSSEAHNALLRNVTRLPDGSELTTEIAHAYTVAENADGTLTYTFEQTHSVEGEGEAGPVSGEAEYTGTTTMGVTLPSGATLVDALSVDPHDPDTIPPGGSVSTEVTSTGSGEGGVSGTRGLWKHLTVGAGFERTVGHTTEYSRAEDGALSIASGPREAFGSSIHARIGSDDWHLRFESGNSNTTTTLEYVEFTADQAGAEAYRDVATEGNMPERIEGGVADRYTETRTLEVGEGSAAIQAGPGGVERSSTNFAVENISRVWPDGHEEFVEYGAPWLHQSGTFSEVVGGTDQESVYRLTLHDDGSVFMNNDQSFQDAYGGREARNSGITVEYSEAEITQMREGAEQSTGMTYETNEDYLRHLAGTSALIPDGGAEQALWSGYNDYNGGTYQTNEPYTGGELPGVRVEED